MGNCCLNQLYWPFQCLYEKHVRTLSKKAYIPSFYSCPIEEIAETLGCTFLRKQSRFLNHTSGLFQSEHSCLAIIFLNGSTLEKERSQLLLFNEKQFVPKQDQQFHNFKFTNLFVNNIPAQCRADLLVSLLNQQASLLTLHWITKLQLTIDSK